MHCLSHLWFEYQCLMFSIPSFQFFEKISQKIHLITTYIRCYWERMGDGPGSWGNIISRRMTCFFITWESSYLWLILPDRCQSLAKRPFFLLQENHIASQICLWPPNQFIWAKKKLLLESSMIGGRMVWWFCGANMEIHQTLLIHPTLTA